MGSAPGHPDGRGADAAPELGLGSKKTVNLFFLEPVKLVLRP